jgi:hypothetical protein
MYRGRPGGRRLVIYRRLVQVGSAVGSLRLYHASGTSLSYPLTEIANLFLIYYVIYYVVVVSRRFAPAEVAVASTRA